MSSRGLPEATQAMMNLLAYADVKDLAVRVYHFTPNELRSGTFTSLIWRKRYEETAKQCIQKFPKLISFSLYLYNDTRASLAYENGSHVFNRMTWATNGRDEPYPHPFDTVNEALGSSSTDFQLKVDGTKLEYIREWKAERDHVLAWNPSQE